MAQIKMKNTLDNVVKLNDIISCSFGSYSKPDHHKM